MGWPIGDRQARQDQARISAVPKKRLSVSNGERYFLNGGWSLDA